MAIYLSESDVKDAYAAAVKYSRQWFLPFDEFERLANNLPSPQLPESYPTVTDGTLAALLIETPMRIWGQQQTGRAFARNKEDKKDFPAWKEEIVNVLATNKIIPNANEQFPFFVKLQTALYRALVYGSCPAYVFPVSRDDGYVGADFVLPNIRQVKLQPGKISDRDSKYIFLETHYDKLQIQNYLDIAKHDKENLGGWDKVVLQEILDSELFSESRDSQDLSTEEQAVQHFGSTVKFVTCFQRGYKAPFYTSVPALENKIVRRMKNRNRTGDLPIIFLYNQVDMVNPYGRGQVELAGPAQNMLDFFTAAHAKATEQGLDPPIKVKGDIATSGVDLDSLRFEGGSPLWMVGDADVDVVRLTTEVYSQFASGIGLYKTNVMNLQGTSDATVSSSAGSPGYSKTPAGVKYQQERTNAKDNYLHQRIDEFFSVLMKNLINLSLVNMSGKEFIKLSEDQRKRLVAAGKEIPETTTKVLVEFKELQDDEFDYDTDANSSKVKNDSDMAESIGNLVGKLIEIPNIREIAAQEGKEIRIMELIKKEVAAYGIEGSEDVIVDITPTDVAGGDASATNGVAPIVADGTQPSMPMEQPQPTMPATPQLAPAVAPVPVAQPMEQPVMQPEMQQMMQPQIEAPVGSPAEEQGRDVQELIAAGVPESTAQLIHALHQSGWSDEEIATYVKQEQEG